MGALARLGAVAARGGRWLLRGPRNGDAVVSWPRRLLSIGSRLLVGIGLLAVLSVGALRWVRPVTTSFILQERVFGDQPVRHGWTPIREIAPDLLLAVVAAEDQRFPVHHGFDLEQIRIALSDGSGRGASTISQQVAKNLYLWPGGGFFRKGVEAGFTVLIETMWPKRRILEVYVNIAEFGPGVFGVTEASRRYYRKEPAELSRSEAARLAAVLPNPKRMSVANPGGYVQRRTGQIVRQMEQLGASYLAGF